MDFFNKMYPILLADAFFQYFVEVFTAVKKNITGFLRCRISKQCGPGHENYPHSLQN
jgi:hypothetical protein